ncbi:Lrp/AsnC family transcriptional regulator [Nocardia sp. alder85J]|uniref:Lrp/AsnC family transcriptional regulator n=1 Tax=Nocardia sp. alder85J TaxID=2862949 RepID=UPI001CD4F01D|nr:Lrp/AsnC family transcriptional regulator [Nocardia sp. alder85J]MCX4094649.1 Lrp/AsnC family transcriptional regulator [Nocardia sp. alder85J]
MNEMSVDAVDRQLVAALQRDGRATHEALAQAVGLSRVAARTRLLRLLDSGSVTVLGIVHPSVFGLHSCGHIGVRVAGAAAPVAAHIAGFDHAAFVSVVSGAYSLVVQLHCPDDATLAAEVNRIATLPAVIGTETAVYTEILKDNHVAPRRSTQTLDEVDLGLLRRLQADGRVSYAELAAEIDMSISAVRTRVLRLIETGTIHIGARIQPGFFGSNHLCGLGITFDEGRGAALATLAELPSVDYLAATLGRCDAICTLNSRSVDEALHDLETVRGVPGVRSVEAFNHLRVVKSLTSKSYSSAAQDAPAGLG